MAARGKVAADRTSAQTALTALGEDADASIRSLIETAIKRADAEIKAADAVLNANFRAEGSLAKYIRDGIETLGTDNSGTPDDVGKSVATAVEAALDTYEGTPDTDHHWAFGDLPLNRATFAGADVKGSAHDAPRDTTMTWQEIAGVENVDSEVISSRRQMVVSLEGLPATDIVDGTFAAQSVFSATAVDAEDSATPTYKGIAGDFYCLAATCPAISATGNIGAGWYFLPTDGDRRYKLQSGETDRYEGAVHAEYGYWLVPATGNAALGDIETFAIAHGGFSADTLLAASTTTGVGFRDNDRANYTGKAIGMSVVTGKDGDDDDAALRSGQFTADVSLTANFAGTDGSTSTVSGTINNFQGPAIGNNWSVSLQSRDLDDPTVAGTALGAGTTGGEWTAQSYGGEAPTDTDGGGGARPTGIVGGFEAVFLDGRAVGAYATRKQ